MFRLRPLATQGDAHVSTRGDAMVPCEGLGWQRSGGSLRGSPQFLRLVVAPEVGTLAIGLARIGFPIL